MINPYELLQNLNFERLAGTDGERRASQLIINILKNFELQFHKEEFSLYTFDSKDSYISINNEKIEIRPFGLENSTRLEGKIIFLENSERLIYEKEKYKNKIILAFDYSRKMKNLIYKSGIAAYIAIGRPYREVNSSSHRQKDYKTIKPIFATISYKNAEKLLKYNNKTVMLHINQKTTRQNAANIVVDIKGYEDTYNTIIATAHYDTVAKSMGSTDNGGGTVILLKMAEYFSQNKPKRNLRLIFFSGEELGLLGSLDYVKNHKEEIQEKVRTIVNIDVSGDPIGIDKFIITGTKEILGYINGINREEGLFFKSSLDIYSSDNMPFTKYEIPSINIARFGGRGSAMGHTSKDNISNVYPPGLDNTLKATKTVLNRLLNAEIFPIDTQIDKSLKEKIERYLYALTGEENPLNWIQEYKK